MLDKFSSKGRRIGLTKLSYLWDNGVINKIFYSFYLLGLEEGTVPMVFAGPPRPGKQRCCKCSSWIIASEYLWERHKQRGVVV